MRKARIREAITPELSTRHVDQTPGIESTNSSRKLHNILSEYGMLASMLSPHILYVIVVAGGNVVRKLQGTPAILARCAPHERHGISGLRVRLETLLPAF